MDAQEFKSVSDAQSLDDLDRSFMSHDSTTGSGSLLLVETSSHLFVKGKNIAVGQHRSVFFAENMPLCDILPVIRESLLGESAIKTMTMSISKPINIQDSDKSKWSQRKGVPSPDYDILLSLLVPEPEINLVTWDIEAATNHILKPVLDDLDDLYSFTGIKLKHGNKIYHFVGL